MDITPSHPGLGERDELARLLPAPAERELPGERRRAIKEFMMGELREAPGPAQRGRRRLWRRPVVLIPALAAATALAVGLSAAVGQTPAYAVAENADGTITIEIHRWEDAKKLQADLRAMGVNIVVDFVPGGKRCRPPRITDPAPREQYRHTLLTFVESHHVSMGFVTKLGPSAIKPGQTAVIEYYHPENAGSAFNGWIANGRVAPCVLEDSVQPW
ncbi:hypothetical protein [Actinomadura rugatobispora]|uniref:Uncharacterized protein n=1 Tax=Actinomadura rugatobispora TaxID=1994 RepID=A0ABW0ZU17_9ACTN|nr:hypothetical protein GCM10010200_001520 [Actinomadura rugatobispora]